MNKTGIVIILLCFLAAAAVVLWERRKIRKTMEEIERMLDAAMTGSFSETNFDESRLSALETKFAHYLSAAEASSRNVAQEKDKIKTLIADISHQTKTPIANLLLYSELLKEETLPASAKANVEALYKQSEKLRFLIDSLVKLSRLCNLDVLHRSDDGTEFIAVMAHHRTGIDEVVPAFFDCLAV